VDPGAAIGAYKSGILEDFLDLGIPVLVIQLAGVQRAMFFGIDAVVFSH
jgi:hypothetical protein